MNIKNSKDPFIAYCVIVTIIGKKIKLKKTNFKLKKEFVIKYSFSKILPTKSPKTKQNKLNQTHCNGESILRYHLCFLVVTFLYQKMNFSRETKKKITQYS